MTTLQKGTSGIADHLPGESITVTGAALAEGGIGSNSFIESDVDDQLFRFNSDDTPLMNLMLKSKRVKVNSPEVDHYVIDEPRSVLTTKSAIQMQNEVRAVLPVDSNDRHIARKSTTLLVKGVDGYDPTGQRQTLGQDLLLFVCGHDQATGNPIVQAVNGRKNSPDDKYSTLPAIPAGTRLIVLGNSLHETQKEVDPDLILPQPTRIYLQKRGMNQVVSDYFDSQRKRIPFSKAVVAEQAIANFKVRGNRTLWAGRSGKFTVEVDRMGYQTVYCTEGLRWQFKRELMHKGRWTLEDIIAMAKMFFTGEDVPKSALLLAGKNLLEQIQCIDFSKHPEIQITQKTNSLGWSVTNFHTVFGDIEIKREPTLDRLGWSNSGALIGEDRIVHYVYSAEHSFNDRIEGQEATRSGILIWDAIALKGNCHLWIDGDSDTASGGALGIKLWSSPEAPTGGAEGDVYYLTCDCPGISLKAKSGEMWKLSIEEDDNGEIVNKWTLYTGNLILE